MITPTRRKPVVWWEILIAAATPSVWLCSLVDCEHAGSPAYWIGFILTLLFIIGIYFLFRIKFNFIKSAVCCISTIIAISVLYGIILSCIAKYESKKPLSLNSQSVNHYITMLATRPFYVNPEKSIPPYFNYIHSYTSAGDGVTITVEYFEIKFGDFFRQPDAVLSAMENEAKSVFAHTDETRTLSPISINGVKGFRVDFIGTMSQEENRKDGYLVKIILQDPSNPSHKGANITLCAEFMPPEKRIKELERIISSIEVHPQTVHTA